MIAVSLLIRLSIELYFSKACCKGCTNEVPRAHQGTTRTNQNTVVAENARMVITIDLSNTTRSRSAMQSNNNQQRNFGEFQTGVSQTPPDREQQSNVEFVQPIRIRPPSYAELAPNLPRTPDTEQHSNTALVQLIPIGLPSFAGINPNQPRPTDTERQRTLEFAQPTTIMLPSYSVTDPNQSRPTDTERQRTLELAQPTPISMIRLPSYSETDPNQPPSYTEQQRTRPAPIRLPSYSETDSQPGTNSDNYQGNTQTITVDVHQSSSLTDQADSYNGENSSTHVTSQ